MELIIIAAVAQNQVIGRHNTIPWQIPEEMEHFKMTTKGHTLIMGRLTYASIGGPLPGRRCIVLSRTPDFTPHPDCTKVATLQEALALCTREERVFIIGGARLYEAALPLADTLIISWIGKEYEGDAFFPDFSQYLFVEQSRRTLSASVPITIVTYAQKRQRGVLP
ncbi:dihydrofolate reductase [Desulfobulbus rhabdoformis]|uniref:dihydrofolate reductase n=1 Tax=Desulfobulbus rhabdoformis TaxID=34032 RepID=UPI0019623242|nr:dihydrofolate reductase [Desulfobulbus rhabdoformis]